ncbi:hypothetical protein ACI0FR_00093 [Paenochrobactrum sp. BZR 201-1]
MRQLYSTGTITHRLRNLEPAGSLTEYGID